MKDPKTIRIEDYDYELPEEKIAHYPLEVRDASKLLVWDQGLKEVSTYRELADYVPAGALMVFNNTKVVQARILFFNENGARIELFCLEPWGRVKDLQIALQQRGEVEWKCFVGGAKKWKQQLLTGSVLVGNQELVIEAENLGATEDAYKIRLRWNSQEMSFAEVLDEIGKVPLPPYIRREAAVEDKERYQTIFAEREGSVAAPTAGLHFTPEVMKDLAAKGIAQGFVTLHVGAGTFKPVKSETIGNHHMHSEQIAVQSSFLDLLLNSLERQHSVVAVGTTACRTLESLYWFGVKVLRGEMDKEWPLLEQWYPYQEHSTLPAPTEAIGALAKYMSQNDMQVLNAHTTVMIVPGYNLRIIDALVTNFHQPQSTLLLLISTVIGEEWRSMYDFALNNQFRFLSYGDGSLLFTKRV